MFLSLSLISVEIQVNKENGKDNSQMESILPCSEIITAHVFHYCTYWQVLQSNHTIIHPSKCLGLGRHRWYISSNVNELFFHLYCEVSSQTWQNPFQVQS